MDYKQHNTFVKQVYCHEFGLIPHIMLEELCADIWMVASLAMGIQGRCGLYMYSSDLGINVWDSSQDGHGKRFDT